MKKDKILCRAIGLTISAGLLAMPFAMPVSSYTDKVISHAEASAGVMAERTFVVTGTVQTKAGATKDWDPGDKHTQMKEIGNGFYIYSMDLPAGAYFYKISANGSWAENYGLNGNFDGANVQLTLDKPQKVTFYYNDKTHKIKDSSSYKMLSEEDLPTIGGDIAGAEGDKVMRDLVMDKFYQTTLKLKAGTYKVTVNQKGKSAVSQQVTVRNDGDVNFYYDEKVKKSLPMMAVSMKIS